MLTIRPEDKVVASTNATAESHPLLRAVLELAAEVTNASGASLVDCTGGDELTGGVPLGVDGLSLLLPGARPRELGVLDRTARLTRQAWVWTQVAAGSESASGRLRRDNFLTWLADKMRLAVERDGALSLLLVELEDQDVATRYYGTGDLEERVPLLYNLVENAVRGIDSVYRCDDATLAAVLPRCDETNVAKVARRVCDAVAELAARDRRAATMRPRLRCYSHPNDLAPLSTGVTDAQVVRGDNTALLKLWSGIIAGTFDGSVVLYANEKNDQLDPVFCMRTEPPAELPRAAIESFLAGRPQLARCAEGGQNSALFLPITDGKVTRGLFQVVSARSHLGEADLEIGRLLGRVVGPLLETHQAESHGTSMAIGGRRHRYDYSGIIGSSAAMGEAFDLLDRIIDTDYPVIIQGESGTGKELIARAIHFNGARADKPLIAENCAALNDNLLEAELFGYEKGSFTGADTSRKGLFELADGGTLFLDEVADMKPSMQKDLLRILQEGIVRPVGGKRFLHVDVRVICACNNDLARLVEEGKFRSDLYYRLNVWNVRMPALRERAEDIPQLVDFFLGRIAEQTKTAAKTLARSVVQAMQEYEWPGNIRELKNEIARMVAMCRGEEITLRDFSKKPSGEILRPTGSDEILTLAEVEKREILRALRHTNGNRSRAAELLGINKATIYRKLKAYGLDR